MSPLKWIDMPPVWLAGAMALAWWIGRVSDLSFGGPWVGLPGGLLVGGGILFMGLALIEMRKWRTTVIPHNTPSRLVTSGIFKRTRNPIYLGDTLVLAGLILYWDAPLALPLVPLFVWLIERRFILPEEALMRREFKADFARFTRNTNRWFGWSKRP